MESGIGSNILYTRVSIEGKLYNYYQKDTTIIITKENYYNKDDYNQMYLCSPSRHINNIENYEKYEVRFLGNRIKNFIFIDKLRILKLNKLYKQI